MRKKFANNSIKNKFERISFLNLDHTRISQYFFWLQTTRDWYMYSSRIITTCWHKGMIISLNTLFFIFIIFRNSNASQLNNPPFTMKAGSRLTCTLAVHVARPFCASNVYKPLNNRLFQKSTLDTPIILFYEP